MKRSGRDDRHRFPAWRGFQSTLPHARCGLAGRKGEAHRYQGRVLCGPASAPVRRLTETSSDCWLTPERCARHRTARRASSADPACGAGFPIRHFTPGGAKLDVELSLVPDNLNGCSDDQPYIADVQPCPDPTRPLPAHCPATGRASRLFAITVAATRLSSFYNVHA